MEDIKVSKNFNLSEFVTSSQFPEMTNELMQDVMDHGYLQELQERLTFLSASILQPTRDAFQNDAMTILSGYRSEDLNAKIGGAQDSDHTYGIAADFSCQRLFTKFMWIYYRNLPYRQLIIYPDQNFIHCSVNIPEKKYKHEALVKYKNDPGYLLYTGNDLPKKLSTE